MYKSVGEKLKLLRGSLSQVEFAKKIGESQPNIQRYENGIKPKVDFIHKLRTKLGVNINWLFDSDAEMYESDTPKEIVERYGKSFKRVPEIAFIDCGLPAAQWEGSEKGFLIVSGLKNYKNLFAFKAKGDSMKPYIEKDDYVICADVPFENIKDYTAIVLVYKSGPDTTEASGKLFYRDPDDKDSIHIYSVNTKYPPKKVHLNTVHKIYKVVRIERDVA